MLFPEHLGQSEIRVGQILKSNIAYQIMKHAKLQIMKV